MNYTIKIYVYNQTGHNNSLISSNTPSWSHHFFVCIYISEWAYFNNFECSFNTQNVHNNKMSIRTRTEIVRRKPIIPVMWHAMRSILYPSFFFVCIIDSVDLLVIIYSYSKLLNYLHTDIHVAFAMLFQHMATTLHGYIFYINGHFLH